MMMSAIKPECMLNLSKEYERYHYKYENDLADSLNYSFLTPRMTCHTSDCPFHVGQKLYVRADGCPLDSGDAVSKFKKGDMCEVVRINAARIDVRWKTGYNENRGDTWYVEFSNWNDLLAYPPSPSFMSSVVDFVKRLALTEDDRALRDAGFQDQCGDLTEQGRCALTILSLKTHKAELVTLAKEMIAEKEKQCGKCEKC